MGRFPLPSPAFKRILNESVGAPEFGSISGEFTASRYGIPLCSPRVAGNISNVYISAEERGREDDSSTLAVTGQVYINGVTCLTTQPVLAAITGEASTNGSTVESGTGITQAVINTSANTFAPGDVITYDLTVTRTGTPETEIKHPCIVVEFE